MKFFIAINVLMLVISCKEQHVLTDNFEVVKEDYHKDWLQRIFVVAAPDKLNDTSAIAQIICTLKERYPLTEKSAVSFFSERRYADYKTVLFMDGPYLLPATEYDDWANAYIGEYELDANIYTMFPASDDKKRTYNLKGCR